MNHPRRTWVRLGVPCLLGAALAACAPKPFPPPSVEELMQDHVELDGLVLKCNGDLRLARTDPACANARIAVDRLADARDAAEAARREAEFERRREELRLAEEEQRLTREEAEKVDAYTLPIVPVGPQTAPVMSKSQGTVPPARAAGRSPATIAATQRFAVGRVAAP